MKIVKRILLFIVLLLLIFMAFGYWGVYESGLMAGKVLRISEKGVLFKTYEGKLNLETFGALKGTSPIAESFDFSVEGDETQVIKDLQTVSLTGERVLAVAERRPELSIVQLQSRAAVEQWVGGALTEVK